MRREKGSRERQAQEAVSSSHGARNREEGTRRRRVTEGFRFKRLKNLQINYKKMKRGHLNLPSWTALFAPPTLKPIYLFEIRPIYFFNHFKDSFDLSLFASK
jgi:hypothetical protein